jgi:putative addiction module CopG family antidote
MTITISPELVALIEDKVANGGFRDANEVIGAALELLDADVRRLRDAVEEGVANGDPVEVDLDSLKAHLKTGAPLRFL